MSYQPNPMNANGVNEQEVLDDAKKNLTAIIAYSHVHNTDLEHAYTGVTGRPYPAGRSLKLTGNGFEMTKDRTVKSVLGKYVAPIAAGALTAGFGIPALVGAGSVEAGGATTGA